MKQSEIHSPRVARLRRLLDKSRVDSLLVTDIYNVFYLTGFTGSTATAVVDYTEVYILVDARYLIQARMECPQAIVSDYSGKDSVEAAAEMIADLKCCRTGYEADHLSVSQYRKLRSKLRGCARICSTKGLVRGLRQTKDAQEISLIRQAASITDAALKSVMDSIKPGLKETEVALMVDTQMRRLGADKEGFDTIAASGPNSACPHARPTDRHLKTGDLLKMDFGARFSKYHADITRTVSIGAPKARHREVYDIVLKAQDRAIAAIAPGKRCSDIDAVARDIISAAGFADNFGHGLGHSIGIQVHEEPRFSPTCDTLLEPGMVMTVEPGIYIEGWGGVRIEDDVVVTRTGCELITHSPKDLVAL